MRAGIAPWKTLEGLLATAAAALANTRRLDLLLPERVSVRRARADGVHRVVHGVERLGREAMAAVEAPLRGAPGHRRGILRDNLLQLWVF